MYNGSGVDKAEAVVPGMKRCLLYAATLTRRSRLRICRRRAISQSIGFDIGEFWDKTNKLATDNEMG